MFTDAPAMANHDDWWAGWRGGIDVHEVTDADFDDGSWESRFYDEPLGRTHS